MGSLALYTGTPVLIPVIEPSVLYNTNVSGFDVGTLVTPIYYRIVGDNIEAEGRFTTGTTQAATAVLTLPNSWTVATPGGNILTKGRWTRITANSATNRKTGPLIFTNGTGAIGFGSDEYATANAPATALNGNLVAGNGEVIEVTFSIPITSLVALGSYRVAGAGVSTTLPSLIPGGVENVNHTSNFTGPTTVNGVVIPMRRIGKQVTLNFPAISNTGNNSAGNLTMTTGLPVGFRPVSDIRVPIFVTDAGAAQAVMGQMYIGTAGNITISKTALAAFVATTSAVGTSEISVTYGTP